MEKIGFNAQFKYVYLKVDGHNTFHKNFLLISYISVNIVFGHSKNIKANYIIPNLSQI